METVFILEETYSVGQSNCEWNKIRNKVNTQPCWKGYWRGCFHFGIGNAWEPF